MGHNQPLLRQVPPVLHWGSVGVSQSLSLTTTPYPQASESISNFSKNIEKTNCGKFPKMMKPKSKKNHPPNILWGGGPATVNLSVVNRQKNTKTEAQVSVCPQLANGQSLCEQSTTMNHSTPPPQGSAVCQTINQFFPGSQPVCRSVCLSVSQPANQCLSCQSPPPRPPAGTTGCTRGGSWSRRCTSSATPSSPPWPSKVPCPPPRPSSCGWGGR